MSDVLNLFKVCSYQITNLLMTNNITDPSNIGKTWIACTTAVVIVQLQLNT